MVAGGYVSTAKSDSGAKGEKHTHAILRRRPWQAVRIVQTAPVLLVQLGILQIVACSVRKMIIVRVGNTGSTVPLTRTHHLGVCLHKTAPVWEDTKRMLMGLA